MSSSDETGWNYRDTWPSVLRVVPLVEQCARHNCEKEGALVQFEISFHTEILEIRGDRVMLGLRGGVLKADIAPCNGAAKPERIIQLTASRKEKTTLATGITAGSKSLAAKLERTRESETEGCTYAISTEGTSCEPAWLFQAIAIEPFINGVTREPQVYILASDEDACGCRYEFSTARSDWSFDIQIASSLSPLRRAIHRLRARRDCRRLLRTCYTRTLAEGEWRCPILTS